MLEGRVLTDMTDPDLVPPEERYAYLDVRTEFEFDEGYAALAPGVKLAVNIPIIKAKPYFNSETNSRDYRQSPNKDFVKMVEKKYPDKDTKIMITCSDGSKRTIMALMALDEAGYTNLVGMRGGYFKWTKFYDNKMRRRKYDNYQEVYTADGDGCGIHGTGAGFANLNKEEGLPEYDAVEWIDYQEAMEEVAA